MRPAMDTVTAADGDARYRQLFNAIDQGFCVIEMIFDDQMSPIDYRFIEVNDAFAAQTGLVDATSRTMRAHAPAHEQHWFDIYGEIALTRQSKRFEAAAAALGHDYEVYAFPFDAPGLRRVGVLFNDIAPRKQLERMQKTLIAELNHRVKNTLAVVQSVATQSLHRVDRPALDGFLGRLQALASAHDQLVQGHWLDASIDVLIHAVTAPYQDEGPSRVQINGPDLKLNPKAAQSLTLALHEMATNAAKYGALSVPAGQVAVSWDYTGHDHIALTWAESGGPEILQQPTRRGFGTRLIQDVLTHEFGAEIRITYPQSGLIATITAPAGAIVAPVR
ncbi:hypothetical protein KvSKV_14860 (plasmid) [Ketogulonicigenium vulgare]|uniref:histidine kinase n=4 Tax=Ketogulonicigenium vulgare TaxID=92945 RepID=F9YB16_KETVW|nr:sensor histidine kinase [Ketogulonicigenium vulgare]AEM42568.1 Signal transduction histidine kinase [Ketogulonicigenium vulgare WSH-001]ALJ82672.1 hypothetical protein KVH_14970 [Ketogulonicigenium vulgare]ANW35442.1 hypothetical protein KvSKV_14860 [Ketogulonicigenium vulgare]